MISISEISNLYIATAWPSPPSPRGCGAPHTTRLPMPGTMWVPTFAERWSICVKQIDIKKTFRKNGCLRWFSMKLIG